MKNRIGYIREVVTSCGGRGDFIYYADGPRSDMHVGNGRGTVYKIEKGTDGLNPTSRAAVAALLNNHPEVEKAYVSRPMTRQWPGGSTGQHLKVIFKTTARG